MTRFRLSARPLLDSETDAALFVPLGHSFDELASATDRGYTVLVHGARGSGRTTLLRALLRHRRRHGGAPTAFVQASRARTPSETLRLCREALLDVLGTRVPDQSPDGPTLEALPSGTPGSVSSELAALAELCAPARATFLVDNLDAHLAHRLFGIGRDDLWEVAATFVVSALDEDLPIVLAPPADAFFEARVAVPAPTRSEAEEILARRLGRKVEMPDPPPTPRALLDAARRDPEDPASADAERLRRLDEAAALGTSALEVARLLDDVGSVSASDAEARDRLGVSAARLSQVLAQMYDENLVTYEDVRGGGPGRPRRRYRWATPVGGGGDDGEATTTGMKGDRR